MSLVWGVVVALAVSAVCVRWGVWRWLTVLAAVPAVLLGLGVGDVPGRGWLLALAVSVVLVAGAWPWPRAWPPVGLAGGLVIGLVAGLLLRPSSVAAGPVVVTLGGVGAVLALAAAAGLGRSADRSLRGVCALVGGVPLLAAVGARSADSAAALAWWPAAGALGLTALLRGRRGIGSQRPQTDAVDEEAIAAFRERYGVPALGPVAIVIAAYNEAEGIPGVLETLPRDVCGLPADVIVVDDGSSDGTAEALATTRAHVVACPANRGQGAALRLGYRLARDHGAAYVLTTDADGQYDVADFPTVLQPILDDRADFVTGSRILGAQHTHDKVRRVGVHVFAWLATVLTGRRLTDTSFGLRAMRAEVTAAVTLNQPQYQSSELMLGAISHGFRVLEVPGTMHVRSAGSTKKGRNLVYGSRYGRVMTGTWWREGLPRPVTETAPALHATLPSPLRQTRDHVA